MLLSLICFILFKTRSISSLDIGTYVSSVSAGNALRLYDASASINFFLLSKSQDNIILFLRFWISQCSDAHNCVYFVNSLSGVVVIMPISEGLSVFFIQFYYSFYDF